MFVLHIKIIRILNLLINYLFTITANLQNTIKLNKTEAITIFYGHFLLFLRVKTNDMKINLFLTCKTFSIFFLGSYQKYTFFKFLDNLLLETENK